MVILYPKYTPAIHIRKSWNEIIKVGKYRGHNFLYILQKDKKYSLWARRHRNNNNINMQIRKFGMFVHLAIST